VSWPKRWCPIWIVLSPVGLGFWQGRAAGKQGRTGHHPRIRGDRRVRRRVVLKLDGLERPQRDWTLSGSAPGERVEEAGAQAQGAGGGRGRWVGPGIDATPEGTNNGTSRGVGDDDEVAIATARLLAEQSGEAGTNIISRRGRSSSVKPRGRRAVGWRQQTSSGRVEAGCHWYWYWLAGLRRVSLSGLRYGTCPHKRWC
jgi:hypothetical protein